MEGKKGEKHAAIPKISPGCNLYLHVRLLMINFHYFALYDTGSQQVKNP